ncbi:MAG: serine/threonine-protein kinase [Mariprofundus sp.]|nr:serine/threonine-protein kinase [Mariprofundus sp.]
MSFGAIWKSNWFVGGILTLLFVLAVQQQTSPMKTIERMIYDVFATQTTTSPDDQIVILNIDASTLHKKGLTPRQAITSSIHTLTAANASFIGIDATLKKPATPSTINPNNSHDALEDAVRNAGNIVLPLYFEIDETNIQSQATMPGYFNAMALKHVNTNQSEVPVYASGMSAPYKELSLAAAGIGHMSIINDSDGVARSETMIIAYGKHYFPSLPLLLAAKSLNIPLDDIRIHLGDDIELGPLSLTTDTQSRIYPSFSQAGGTPFFQTYTFSQLHEGKIPATAFKNKIILISNSDHRSEQTFSSPGNQNMARIEFSAHVLRSILHKQLFQRPSWTYSAEVALLLIIGLYLIYLLPRISTRSAATISGLAFIVLIGSDLIALQYYSTWLQTTMAALLLLIGHIAVTYKQRFVFKNPKKKPLKNLHNTNKMLGTSFQNQGMLDQAFEKFLSCPINDDMLTTLYKLGLAFERKRQFKQATAVYEHISSHNPDYQDVTSRMNATKNSDDTTSDSYSNTALATLLLTGNNIPTLGRYEIISELGKGAMGTVYLGKDPKINRKVAIKTMALSQEFEPEELEDVKTKFFHEAEIAGMLNHPNIVTIFDAGDEHDLAYIAMEFLDGIDLSPYTKKGRLLPFSTTLKVVGKVAEALQYAHSHGVIHRDIKPANIMILKNKSVKVTDFGIAHIIDSSKSKAGVVLGTPSYMSPEQLSGKPLDGRSDLFSLGVMLYELASGVRPFRAESLSKLMYKIAKQPHVDIREHNPDVPECICQLIDELLTKKAAQRIETASDVLGKVSLCLQSLKNNGESQ